MGLETLFVLDNNAVLVDSLVLEFTSLQLKHEIIKRKIILQHQRKIGQHTLVLEQYSFTVAGCFYTFLGIKTHL